MKNMSITLQRILIGGAFGIFALFLLLFTPQIIFKLFTLLLFLMMIFEYAAACSKKKISPLLLVLIIFLFFRIGDFFLNAGNSPEVTTNWLMQQIIISALLAGITFFFQKGKYQQIFLFFGGCLWIIIPFFFFIAIFQFPNYQKILLFLVIIAIANDSFAYFIGKKWGKKKIAPSISPNKTYLGSLAGLLGAVLVALVLEFFWHIFGYSNTLLLALLLAFSGQIGDLLASKIKRKQQIKDYGKILLGHGGMLDRLDSLLISAPIYYFFISYLHFYE